MAPNDRCPTCGWHYEDPRDEPPGVETAPCRTCGRHTASPRHWAQPDAYADDSAYTPLRPAGRVFWEDTEEW